MKKLILIIIFLLSFQICFSFDLFNSKGEIQDYFSTSEPFVFVKTSQNLSNYSVSYSLSANNFFFYYNLTPCSSDYCGDFSLLDLITTENGSFSGSSLFKVKLNDEEKIIYFDFKKPNFQLLNWSLDKNNRMIKLNFTYSDNFLKIKSLNLYLKNNSNLVFIADLNNLSNYDYTIENEGILNLLFKIEDLAGNINEVEKTILVEDFFPPKITYSKLISNSGNFQLEFELEDKNLTRYEITQGSTLLSENIYGTSLYKKVNLPFESGAINFKVLDGNSNEVSLSYDLSSSIINNYKTKYSSQKIFEFESNSDLCVLSKIDGETINKNFSKDSNKFSIGLDITEEKLYNLAFYCENNILREYYEREFIYDNTKPSSIEIFAEKTDDGNIDISWTKSSDTESEIIYELYRNGDDIYSGSKNDYLDLKVGYPKSYIYYVKVSDLAGNFVESNRVNLTPNKIYVELETNLESENIVLFSNYNFELKTDSNSNVEVKVINSGNIIDSKILTNVDHISNININLSKGVNEIIVTVTDEFLNQRSQSYFITANPPEILAKIEEEIVQEDLIQEAVIENIIEESSVETVFIPAEEIKSSSFWIWFTFWVLILGIFIWIIIFNEEKLKKHMSMLSKKKSKYDFKRRNDLILKKHVGKVKKERIIKQKEKENFKKQLALKNKKAVSKYDEEKIKNLSYKKQNMDYAFSTSRFSSKPNKKSKLNSNYGQHNNNNITNYNNRNKPKKSSSLSKDVSELKNNIKESFMGIFKPKQKEKQDEFSNYLQKKHGEKSWKSQNDYVQKKEIVSEQVKPNEKNNPSETKTEVKKEKIDIFAPKEKKEIISQKTKATEIKTETETKTPVEKRKINQFSADKLSLDDYLN
ncbi:MAG: hypothetical protein KC550_04770, partial [Nanoarchaeota archaeon]|nr:hypothetical protein [Nanoarchaeota archaeon]